VQPAATTGTSTWTTYSPRFNVSYSSYIPVDNVIGPTPCSYFPGVGGLPIPHYLRYRGDAYRGTYRTTQSIFVAPAKQLYNNFFRNTGPTRNYGVGSPANNSTLSSTPDTPDIYNGPYSGADEDNKSHDCYLWHQNGQADVSGMENHSVTFNGSDQAVITLSGSANDPLEPSFGGIRWNATITLDYSNPNDPTAQLSLTSSCYPAHIVKVNGVTLPLPNPQPEKNNTKELARCLLFPSNDITRTTSAIHVPNH
jgi:hypothetical protein